MFLPTTGRRDRFFRQESCCRSSCCGTAETNLTSIHEDVGLIPGLTQWVEGGSGIAMSCGIADIARIWFCCGCGVGWQLQL